ncbi:DEAD/DEAH box helicase [Halobacterium salinarum]|uniref:DEAD/DEAH box helicase n=1 Tax=Halobacterium salinarum TaxID=2242 RepID=UPI00255668A8|nr:DEAD/DEAH box helicase [Halobacterium salinarum]MDL0118312.1 DEAD/DEAH box helicase [Halobacterium salinarum]MDL0119762.1 DEAD/DEAH box helicase [Halobacterium salinarum]
MENPAKRAEAAMDAYRNHFIGAGGRAARNVAHRFEATDNGEDSVIGFRGPYLQALDVANWSTDSWLSFSNQAGIHPLVRLAFEDIGFRRLYDFQERSIETILDGQDTVITAATGRGKTEAWLIPILDYILNANQEKIDESDPDDVKAVLTYPTKALAQDQLKRLIQYLYRINAELPTNDRITVGIYDGDTPSNMSSRAEGYLNATFKYFECPGYNDALEKCQNCGKSVHVRNAGQRYELEPEKKQCVDDVPLDFLRLTKNEILEEGVDILLTNPDTINLKLINTNASDEHDAFVYEPQFFVFDEVHTYDGLFGSYTATLTKRIRALRETCGVDAPQVIASSATVENDVELFRRISGAADVAHVDENPRTLDPPSLDELPRALYEESITAAQVRRAVRGEEPYPTALDSFEPDIDNPNTVDNESLDELLGDALFEHLTTTSDDPVVHAVQHLHQELADEPRTREAFLDALQAEYALTGAQAETVLANFRTLGEYSGLLENRSHLFSWPLDGFYACAQCTAVYRSPQDTCSECESGIVTRATYCRRCAEEALIAWYCPECDQLESYTPSEEGSFASRDEQYCGRCAAARDDEVRLLRVTFTPVLKCQSCGATEERSVIETCTCGAAMTRTAADEWTCTNPQCERTKPADTGCPDCGSEQRTLRRGDAAVECPSCGETHDAADTPRQCMCGHSVANTHLIPWVCAHDGCTRQYHSPTPPEECDCGAQSFVKQGLFEVFENDHCTECDTAVLPGSSCECDESDLQRQADAFQSYQTVTSEGRIAPARGHTSVVSCRHQRLGYRIGQRYDELVRSPNNIAVTTSQYLLREVADDEAYSSAKMLSFSDSHRDMKELGRDFNEPEAETLLDQALIEAIRASDDSWPSLDDVLADSLAGIDALHDELSPPRNLQDVSFDLKKHLVDRARRFMGPDEAIRDRLLRRAVPHSYTQRFRERGGSLASDGIVDVRVEPTLLASLTDAERDLLRGIVDTGNSCPADSLPERVGDCTRGDVIDALIERGVLDDESDDYLSLNPASLELTLAGDADSIQYDPESTRFSPSWRGQLGLRSRDLVPFETTLAERGDPSHPQFHQRAYRAEYSRARILIAKVYLGMTDKRERRELEYLFREGNYPHFLSSGPTMELGVDIGDLDALLLYGVPPNMNAYLQRVGRAGRSSHSSLVHSVSQRNPIDYYYYEEPTDLISADPKPVPLNEHNEEVLRVSLSWAVFDYIAANFVAPWEIDGWGPSATVSGGDDFRRRDGDTDDSDYGKLTHLMTLPVSKLGLDTNVSKLAALGTIVSDNERQIREHLRSLLAYQYCTDCSAKYDRSTTIDTCRVDGCDGQVLDAQTEFGGLVDEAVASFQERYLDQYRTYRNRLVDEQQALSQERTELRREKRRASRDESKRLRRRENAVAERISALQDHLDTLERQSYSDFLQNARTSKFAFTMRNVSNNVGLTLVTEHDGEYERREVGGNYGGRNVRMAIQELHPAAAYLDDGETYVVSHLRTDDFESSSLREQVAEAETSTEQLAEEKVCSACHTTHPLSATECPCDHDAPLKRRRLVAMDSVEAHRDDLRMSKDGDPARELYQKPAEEVQNTYAERETSVLEFEPVESFRVQDGEGTSIGTLEYGDYTVLTHTESYRAKYKTGETDPRTTPFEVCGEENCSGIVYRDDDGHAQCSADPEHSPNRRGAASEYVRLGYSYETSGIRVSLDDAEQSHTFVHGLRVALQSLGGVNIRELNETTADDHVNLLDAQEGGANIAKLLVERDAGDFRNFQHAMELVRGHFVCDCEDGCPLCLYQYGCDEHNQPRSFARDAVLDYFELGLPTLEPIDTATTDSPATDS